MATEFFTHGPCVVHTATGTANAYEVLGVSVGKADIAINHQWEPFRSDAAGKAPADLIFLGDTAEITVTLSHIDKAVLAKIRRRAGASATDGQAGAPGSLLGAGGHAHGLYFPTAIADPWVFPTAVLRTNGSNLGTEQNLIQLRFFAWRLVGPTDTTAASKVLYTRAAP